MCQSSEAESAQFAMVLWIEEGLVSVISTKYITNKKMLYNNRLKDFVSYPKEGHRKPKNGWSKYEAVVLKIGATKKTLNDQIKEATEQYNADLENAVEKIYPKYALVLWRDTGNNSVVFSSSIPDTDLFENPSLTDFIPSGGADSVDRQGSVIKLSDDEDELKREAENIISEYLELSVERAPAPQSPLRNEKRKHDGSDSNESDDSEIKTKYKKLKSVHEQTKSELREKQLLMDILMQEVPTMIRDAVSETLNKDFLVSAIKEAFPGGLTQVPVREPAGGPIQPNEAVELAKNAIIQHMEEDLFDIQTRNGLDASKITKNLVLGMFTERELLTSTLSGNPRDREKLPNILSKEKVNLIQKYVTARFPNTTTSKLNKSIGEKLRDFRKSKGLAE